MSSKEKKETVNFGLDNFEVRSYSYNRPEQDVDPKNINYDIKFRFGGDIANDIVFVEFNIGYSASFKKNDIVQLGSIITRTTFEISDLSKFENDEGDIDLPKALTITLLSIAFSTTRGGLLVKSEGNLLSKNILPLVSPKEMYEIMKDQASQNNDGDE